MKALVTGAGGFVGGHLLAHLRHNHTGISLFGTVLSASERTPALAALGCATTEIDLREPGAVRDMLAAIRPDRIFHLAGQAFVPRSFEAPWETLETNIRGTLNLLEAMRALQVPARILVVGSADMYGASRAGEGRLDETTPFMPSSPYSVSKIAQDMLAWQYTRAHGVFTVRVRPFNHIGPGQHTRFAVSDWAFQIAEIEAGQRAPVIHVGSLDAARDFTDVRDVVRAYTLALEDGQPGDVFNVCSGQAYTMRDVLERLIALSPARVTVQTDASRVRPVEIPILYGDYSLLRQRTGWEPRITLEQSLRDVLDEWRQRVRRTLGSSS